MMFSSKVRDSDIYRRHAGIQWQIIENQAVLIDPLEAELIQLDELGSTIWQYLDGTQKMNDILELLTQQYDAPSRKIRQDLTSFIRKLEEREFVEKV